jgi:hypothetical protein
MFVVALLMFALHLFRGFHKNTLGKGLRNLRCAFNHFLCTRRLHRNNLCNDGVRINLGSVFLDDGFGSDVVHRA